MQPESGQNTMGFHSDSYVELVPESSIAIVSLVFVGLGLPVYWYMRKRRSGLAASA